MHIQVASDIHLERNPGMVFSDVLKPNADVLVLAGDVGNPVDPSYFQFLQECSKAFHHTILVAGNHEYRRAMPLTMHEVDLHMAAMCKQLGNVHYLAHGNHMCIGDINFIGATMWTPIREHAGFSNEYLQALNEMWSQQRMNAGTAWSIAENNKTFEAHIREIQKGIAWGSQHNKRNVVITHHSPLLTGPFAKKDLPTDYLYGVDLSQHISAPAISAWLFGHTHHNYVARHQGAIIASNQYGARGISGWSPNFTISI